MNHEQQYIDIYDSHRELIEAPCATLLNEERRKAYSKFKEQGLPGLSDEDYRHSDLSKHFAANYGMNLGRVESVANPYEVFTCDVPNLKSHQEFIINDTYYKADKDKHPLASGVIIGSLNDIAKSNPQLIAPYYNRLAQEGDSMAQFNTTFTQDGIVIYIPKGVVVDEIIQLVTIQRANVQMMSNRRILIILEDGASLNMLICDHTQNEHKTLATEVAEVFVGNGASMNLYTLEETSESNARIAQLFVSQQGDSRFNHSNITLTNGFTYNRVQVSLEGCGAESDISGLVINDKRQHTDNRTLVDHKVAHCNSNELYKYILDEDSTGVFAGKMLIRKDAQHTNSQQTNRNLCLTKCAHMYAQPQLEIYADDVKCSHGSTVGQLDENALFYMQQRGIPIDEARHLLMFAFAGEVIDKIAIEGIRNRLHILAEKRFRGELTRCNGCSLCSEREQAKSKADK